MQRELTARERAALLSADEFGMLDCERVTARALVELWLARELGQAAFITRAGRREAAEPQALAVVPLPPSPAIAAIVNAN
jgi:hypothetical protein